MRLQSKRTITHNTTNLVVYTYSVFVYSNVEVHKLKPLEYAITLHFFFAKIYPLSTFHGTQFLFPGAVKCNSINLCNVTSIFFLSNAMKKKQFKWHFHSFAQHKCTDTTSNPQTQTHTDAQKRTHTNTHTQTHKETYHKKHTKDTFSFFFGTDLGKQQPYFVSKNEAKQH